MQPIRIWLPLALALSAAPTLAFALPASDSTEIVVPGRVRAKPTDAPPPLSVYAAPPRIRQIALSGSGRQLAYVTHQDGLDLLVVRGLTDKTQKIVKLDDSDISALWWADDGHVVAVVARKGLRGTCAGGQRAMTGATRTDQALSTVRSATPDGTAESAVTQAAAMASLDSLQSPACAFFGVHEEDLLTLIDVAASRGEDIGRRMGDAPNVALGVPRTVTIDGRRQLMGPFMEMRAEAVGSQPAQRVYLWRIDPASGRGKLIDDGGGDLDRENAYVDDWLVDRDGGLRARAVFVFRSRQYRIEVRQGDKWFPALTRPIVATDKTFAPYLVGLAGDGAVVILDSETHGKDTAGAARRFHYYRLAADGALSGPLESGDASQNRPIFDPRTGRLAGFATSAEEPGYSLSDPELNLLYGLARTAAPGKSVSVLSLADDPETMLVKVQGREDTGSYAVIDYAAKTSVDLGEDYPDVPTEWIAGQEQIDYRAGDGQDIQALLTLPPKPDGHGLPLIVLPHDGPRRHDTLGFDWLAQALATRGYLVIQPNYRGSDGHGADFERAGYGQWDGRMLSDLSDGVAELVRQGRVDPKRVCYVGLGYGGYAALKAAGHADTRCAVAIGGISDVGDYLAWKTSQAAQPDTDDYAGLVPDPHSLRGFAPDPASLRALRDYIGGATTSRVTAADIHAPVLLIHAAIDIEVPARQSRTLRDNLKAAGKDVGFIELPGADHALDNQAARLAVLEAVTAFLARANPAD